MNCSEMCYDLFKNHVVINMGQSPKSEFYNNDGIGMPFLQGNRTFGFKYPYYDTYCSDIKKIAEKSDVLFSVRAPVGDVNIATERVCIGRGLASLRMKNGNQEYLYYLLKANRKYIENRENGTVFGSINKKGLEELEFYFPSDEVQNKISKVLTILDNKIQLNTEMNKTLEEMAQALFKRWFVDFEFPNDEGKPYKSSGGEMVESELGMIPKGWNISSLYKIADYLNGLAMQKYRPETDEYIPVLKIKDLGQGKTDANSDKARIDIPEQYIINDGDVIFAWSGTLMVKIWTGGIAGLNQHLFKVTSTNYDKWFYYLWTCFHLEKFKAIAKDRATTMGHIKRSNLSESYVLIPNKDIYDRLNKVMTPIIEQIIEINIQSKKIVELRDSLLPKLMSGEIRVEDIEANL